MAGDSLDSRLSRLSPEQQREVEDFVDFLLQRQAEKTLPMVLPASSVPVSSVPPPMAMPEAFPEAPAAPAGDPDWRNDADRWKPERSGPPEKPHEIRVKNEDLSINGYLDYGVFEDASTKAPSPATAAVQRVRSRLSGRKTGDAARDLLEWIE